MIHLGRTTLYSLRTIESNLIVALERFKCVRRKVKTRVCIYMNKVLFRADPESIWTKLRSSVLTERAFGYSTEKQTLVMAIKIHKQDQQVGQKGAKN